MAYFDFVDPGIHSWGRLMQINILEYNWALFIPVISLLIVVSSLYLLGDALRERLELAGA